MILLDEEIKQIVPGSKGGSQCRTKVKITEFSIRKNQAAVKRNCGSVKRVKHIITERMDELNLDKSKVLPLNMGGMMIYICPNCRTLQLPQEVFDQIFQEKLTQKIIT